MQDVFDNKNIAKQIICAIHVTCLLKIFLKDFPTLPSNCLLATSGAQLSQRGKRILGHELAGLIERALN